MQERTPEAVLREGMEVERCQIQPTIPLEKKTNKNLPGSVWLCPLCWRGPAGSSLFPREVGPASQPPAVLQ